MPDKAASVNLPAPLGGRVSQTMLRHYARCPRSGFLYALTRHEPGSTPEMQRGSALHAVHERAVLSMLEADEHTIPPELVKAIVNEVLADPEFHVPFEEHDYLREMSYRWAAETAIDPATVVACETLFELDVAGWVVRARIDFAELLEDGAAVRVVDLKSSRAVPAFDEISRKRPDGSLAGKNFQLVIYALMCAYGVPVREEPCGTCGGGGWAEPPVIYGPDSYPGASCPACEGKGRIEVRDPFPVASRAQRFDLEFVYPGVKDRDDKMARRAVTLTRVELEEYRTSLEGLIRRLQHSEESGDWPAVASDSACAECPASQLCPIPVEVRDHRGSINSLEQASEAAHRLFVEKREHAARQKELREWAKAHDVAVPFGADMEMRLVYSESERVTDRDGMFAQMERAVRYGEEFDRSRFVKVQGRTEFKAVQVTAKELAARQSEGSKDERSADEKWGPDAPW